MKKTTYALIALIALIMLVELALFLLVRSTGHPRAEDTYYTTESSEPIEMSSLSVEVPEDAFISLPYGATTDSVIDRSNLLYVDTLIIIAPKGHMRVY